MKIQRDKLMHFTVCCCAAVMVMVLFRAIASPLGAASLASLLTSIGIGVGKEYGDKASPYNKWDWKDIVADTIGAITGMAAGMLLWIL